MKKEMLNNLQILINSIEGIEVKGRNSVLRMRDVFLITEGMIKYISEMPDEVDADVNIDDD